MSTIGAVHIPIGDHKDDTTRVLLSDVGPFTTGTGCSELPVLKLGIDRAIAAVRDQSVKTVLVLGSGDAQWFGKSTAEFGNDAGLAVSRARCVVGWLVQELAMRGLRVDFSIGVQDAVDRSASARQRGSPDDRRVQVFSIRKPSLGSAK